MMTSAYPNAPVTNVSHNANLSLTRHRHILKTARCPY